MVEASDEIPLTGGRTAASVVRCGDVVRRSTGPRAEFTQRLLRLLEERGCRCAPRFLGLDEQQREVLSFIEGEVPHREVHWTDDQLVTAAQMIRQIHDATAGSELAAEDEVVCHNDLAPWNLVLQGDTPVAFIDFDEAAPGSRVDDLAYFLWTFLELGSDIPAGAQAARIRLLLRSYGLADDARLVSAILQQQRRILAMRERRAQNDVDAEARQFSACRAVRIRAEIAWVQANRRILDAAIKDDA